MVGVWASRCGSTPSTYEAVPPTPSAILWPETEMAKIAINYYSSTGNTYLMAQGAAEGARATGSQVRLLKVAELAPDAAIDNNPAWRAHVEATRDIPTATP